MSDALLTIGHPDGTVRAHRVATLAAADRALVAPIFDQALADAGCSPAQFLVVLSDLIADQHAYARVCNRKGLLAL